MSLGGVELGLLKQSTVGTVEELEACCSSSSIARCLLNGDFPSVLRDPAVQSLLLPDGEGAAPIHSAAEFYEVLRTRIQTHVHESLAKGDGAVLEALLAAGASCLNVFTQHNLTGPYEPEDPSPLQLLAPHLASLPATSTTCVHPSNNAGTPALTQPPFATSSPVSDPSTDALGRPSTQASIADKAEEDLTHPHERMAAEQLTLDGEDLITRKISHLQHLLLSEALLVGPLLSAPQPAPAQAPIPAPHTPSTSSSHSGGLGSTAPSSTTAAGAHPPHSQQGGAISPAVCEGLRSKAGVAGASWLWWALRVTCMHQHVLAGRSATLLARTNALTKQLLASITVAPSQAVSPAQPQPPSAAAAAAAAAAGQVPARAANTGPKDLTKAAAAVATAKGAATVPTAGQGCAAPADDWRHVLQFNPALHACMLLEMALGQYSYGFVEHGQKLLNEAGTVLGLQVQLSGALGRRTVYQENAKAQLVVRSSRVRAQQPPIQDPLVTSFGFEPILQPQAAAAASGVPVSPGGGGGTEAEKVHSKQPTHGMVDESDVFMAPKLVAEDGQVLEPRYSATEQALLLAWATHVKKGSAQDELQLWEMAPYLEAVLSQPRSHMMLQATARLLKARHERTRNRTRERALLHMEQLLEALAAHPASSTRPQPESDSRGADGGASKGSQGEGQQASSSGSRNLTNTHLPYAYDCWFPLRVHLRKELAEHYMSMGFVGAALGIYEELQLWDALVVCYRLLDKRGAAEDLLKRRLKVTPDDPVIWCNLGDLYTDDSYYEEAWKRSGCRHARSKRSLGRSALRRKDYAVAAAHFEEALAVNPLNPDAWFSQGYAYLKLGEQRKALRALTNVTQQVPEHAEAWNNVAALWLELGEPKRAYSALGECLRYKRDSWQIWENYAQVAQQAGFHLQATRALAQVMQLSAGTRLHLPVLHQLVQAVEDTQRGSSNADHNNQRATNSDEAPGGTADTEEGDGDNTDDLAGFVLDIPASLGQLPWAMGSSSGRNGEEEGEAHAALPYQTRSAYQAGVEAAQQRAEEQMRTAVGKVLKDAVNLPCCNPEVWGLLGRYYSLTGQLEGAKEALLKQVRALSGSAAFKSDEARFVEVADASLALAQAYLQLYRGSSSSSSAAPPQGTSSSIQNANLNGSNYSAPAQQESAALAPPASSPAVPCAAAAAAAAAATTPLVVQPGSIRELAAARMHLRGLLKQCEPVFGEHAKWQALSNACAEISAAEVDAKSSQQSR